MCYSWIDLSALDPRRYERCRDRVRRVEHGQQKTLSSGNRAALLENGRGD